jgi:uncharacterized protein
MFSVQRMLGRPGLFFGLLEQSAALGAESISALRPLTARQAAEPSLEPLRNIRRKDKAVVNELEELLTKIFVTPIEREDIESVASELYRIPKVAEMFGEIYSIVWPHVQELDLTIPLQMLENAAKRVVEMVRALAASTDPTEVRNIDARLSQMEADSSAIINNALRRLYEPGGDPLQEIAVHDVYRALTECFDACRSCGRVIALVSLKNS